MKRATLKEHKEFWDSVKDYEKEVFSVYSGASANPIFGYLLKQKNNLNVAYLGVGSGIFLPFLSRKFADVTAVDFSDNLLSKAAKKYKNLKNVKFANCNFTNLKKFHGKFDIVISVNSLSPPTIKHKNIMIKEIFKAIRPKGKFVGILASADVVIYRILLEVEKMLKEGCPEKKAIKEWTKFLEKRDFDPLGFYRDYPTFIRQKYWYPFEIKFRLSDAGFKNIKIKKFYYKWSYCRSHYYGYFPKNEMIWDWFVTADK